MASGYETNKKRQEELTVLGKDLTRRSGSKCELCGASGVSLYVMEVPPAKDEPSVGSAVFVCSICREQIENPGKLEADHWRSLGEKIWSDIVPVKIMAHRILRKVGESEAWAGDILDDAYLDDEEEELVASCPI